MIKRIIVNIILIILLFASMEITGYFTTIRENNIFKQRSYRLESNKNIEYTSGYKILKDFDTSIFRKSYIINNSNKKPIILFGCSFAEGAGLSDNDTPCAKLSQYSKTTCINKSKGATGVQFMYYQLLKDSFYKENPKAGYIIYIYIPDHIQRLYNYQVNPLINMFNIRYKISNGKLKELKPVFKPIYSSFAVKRFLNAKANIQAQLELTNFKLFNLIMSESVNLAKKHYPDVKFIMLEYPELTRSSLPEKELKELEKIGIKVVKVTDLTKDINIYDEKYWLKDNIHPNNDAWNIIIPRLVKKYVN